MKKAVIISIILTIIIIVLAARPISYIRFMSAYNESWEYLMDGDTKGGYDAFIRAHHVVKLKDSWKEDLGNLQMFIFALQDYERESYKSAYEWLTGTAVYDTKGKDIVPKMNKKQSEFYYAKADEINKAYAEHKAEYDERARKNREYAEAEAKKKREEEKARMKAAPYVGMSESKINDTDLGKAEAHMNYNTQCINGEIYSANMYYFKKGGDLVFTARCVNGKVYNISDLRDNPVKNANTEPYRPKKTTEEKKIDPDDLDIEGYYNDYKDDFESIDDAWDDLLDNEDLWDDYSY